MSSDSSIEVPLSVLEKLPIFPLSNVVLFPNIDIPLHIFEPRYRQMMDHVIDSHRMFALGLLDQSGAPVSVPPGTNLAEKNVPPIYPVAGLALIRSAARLPDGLYNIVIRGIARIDVSKEVFEPNSDRLYRVVSAQVRELDPIPNLDELKQEFSTFFALTHRVLGGIEKVKIRFDQKIETIDDMVSFIDAISSLALPSPQHRQSVLGSSSIFERMRIASAALAELLLKTQNFDEDPSNWGLA